MTEISLPLAAIGKAEHTDNKWHKSQTWWGFTAFFCFAGGFLSAIFGLLMSGIGHLANEGFDSAVGTILVALFFPMMMFGAHALDKVSEEERKKTQEN